MSKECAIDFILRTICLLIENLSNYICFWLIPSILPSYKNATNIKPNDNVNIAIHVSIVLTRNNNPLTRRKYELMNDISG